MTGRDTTERDFIQSALAHQAESGGAFTDLLDARDRVAVTLGFILCGRLKRLPKRLGSPFKIGVKLDLPLFPTFVYSPPNIEKYDQKPREAW
jgi:hypothetical protein